jgi:hypothetical protein
MNLLSFFFFSYTKEFNCIDLYIYELYQIHTQFVK